MQEPKKYLDDDTTEKIDKDSTAKDGGFCDADGAAAARPWWLLLAALVILR